jgi:hypothetical protein
MGVVQVVDTPLIEGAKDEALKRTGTQPTGLLWPWL